MDAISKAVSSFSEAKDQDLARIAETIEDAQPEPEPIAEKPEERKRKGRRKKDDPITSKKIISVSLEANDLKKLRFLALANERTVRDEIVALVNDSYKIVAQRFLQE